MALVAPQWLASTSYNLYLMCLILTPAQVVSVGLPLYRAHRHSANAEKQLQLRVSSPRHGNAAAATAGGNQSAAAEKQAGASGAEALRTLDDVLRSIPGRRAFERHLMREFSIECLLFVRLVCFRLVWVRSGSAHSFLRSLLCITITEVG